MQFPEPSQWHNRRLEWTLNAGEESDHWCNSFFELGRRSVPVVLHERYANSEALGATRCHDPFQRTNIQTPIHFDFLESSFLDAHDKSQRPPAPAPN